MWREGSTKLIDTTYKDRLRKINEELAAKVEREREKRDVISRAGYNEGKRFKQEQKKEPQMLEVKPGQELGILAEACGGVDKLETDDEPCRDNSVGYNAAGAEDQEVYSYREEERSGRRLNVENEEDGDYTEEDNEHVESEHQHVGHGNPTHQAEVRRSKRVKGGVERYQAADYRN